MAFSHFLIMIPDKRELLLSHFMEEDTEVQTDEVKKPKVTTRKCPNSQTQASGDRLNNQIFEAPLPRGSDCSRFPNTLN